MAEIALRTLWLTPVNDTDDSMSFPFMSEFARSRSVEGSRRTYGNGRKRSTSSASSTEDWTASLPALTRAQLSWLSSHVGQALCARDDRGGLIFCVYYGVDVTEHQYNEEGDTSLQLSEISYSLEDESEYPVGPS